MKKLILLLISALAFAAATAQVTTSAINGVVTDQDGQPIVGATVIAVHTTSGTQYGAITNKDGRYTLHGLRAGGPYTIEFSHVGYQGVQHTGLQLTLGETLSQNASITESLQIDAIVVTGDARGSAMNINRAGASSVFSADQIAIVPTVGRSLNDIMRLTPQASTTTSGLAIGGGNYRQSFVTVDGAAFNNAFGIGGNLPAGNSPISLNALEQISVAITPYDVRQSGFTGGAINAVTKSGTNQLKIEAYDYYKSDKVTGNRYADGTFPLAKSMSNTLGISIGTPIIKDKLFFFGNFEYEWTETPGNTRLASTDKHEYDDKVPGYNRPTEGEMEDIKKFLKDKFGYDPGRYQNYSIKIPNWKLMARLDWNINRNNSLNVRFSTTKNKYSAAPSSSISPLDQSKVYNTINGRTSDYALYFESARYFQEQNFMSIAAELNSRFMEGRLNNTLRFTYSYQDEPRSYTGTLFPTVDILAPINPDDPNSAKSVFTTFGVDPFTYGNLRKVGTYTVTDELGYSAGIHHIVGGLSFEHDHTENGYMQGGSGYYVYNSWQDFVDDVNGTGGGASSFVITHANRTDLKQQFPSFNYMQYSVYAQDEINFSDRFKATFGVRLEIPVYPSIAGNENKEFTKLFAGNGGYKTSDMPKAALGVSPRFGFNWDMTGERKYILRGGTGIFTGRLPFVWIVSAAANSNCLQAQTIAYKGGGKIPAFHDNVKDILDDLYGGSFVEKDLPAPQSPTIMDKNLKMPSTWKTSLAVDLKLPAGIDLNLEGIYNKDINAVGVLKLGQAEVPGGIQVAGEPSVRKLWASQNIKNTDPTGAKNVNPYLITNTNIAGYYYSLSAQLNKRFNFGLSLGASYTYSNAKNVIDGIGDQVTSAYNTNTFNRNGSNTPELGYSSYVSPHRVLANITYRKQYGGHFGTSVALFYEGYRMGYIGSYSYSRYSYTMNNITNDGGAELLMYIPSKEEVQNMTFTQYVVGGENYTPAEQMADFEAFIQNDKYLSSHRAEYSVRGGAVMPWVHVLNFKFAQDFFVNVKGKRNTITLGVDINNVANLLNRNWGNARQINSTSLLRYNATGGTYQFNNPKWKKYDNVISTWSALLSVRYTFN